MVIVDGGYAIHVRSIFDLVTLDTIGCALISSSSSARLGGKVSETSPSQKMREIVNSALGAMPLIKLDRSVSRATHWH